MVVERCIELTSFLSVIVSFFLSFFLPPLQTLGNNMENMRKGCASGTIDAVVHMGDHAYDMGLGNDYHGDAYMQAFQGVLAQCPWLPVIGK